MMFYVEIALEDLYFPPILSWYEIFTPPTLYKSWSSLAKRADNVLLAWIFDLHFFASPFLLKVLAKTSLHF